MRLRTIKKRLKFAMLPEEAYQYIYEEMKGIGCTAILVEDSIAADRWCKTLHATFAKYPPTIKTRRGTNNED